MAESSLHAAPFPNPPSPVNKSQRQPESPLRLFDPAVRAWFEASFERPTPAQAAGWPAIAGGESTLIFAPTGSGKTLTAFLWCIDRLMFSPPPERKRRCRVIYVSPLKALAVDVDRNLRSPMVGIANAASAAGRTYHVPATAIRTGDTPQRERALFLRDPADILITTPESLYLILTSRAREALRSVDTVIIDEIHALVPTKRGAHLALTLERLDAVADRPPQRIGLSATQRPLDEVARFLGGARPRAATAKRRRATDALTAIHEEFEQEARVSWKPVRIVDTAERKRLALRVQVPVEDMANLGAPIEIPSGPAAQPVVRASIWPAIHPQLLELIRAHRSTLIFVNSRRLAERLAAALNELAGESLVAAHHGSLAPPQRSEIEDALKSGRLPALVATSSLELGIDMGAIDLVVQIESPPSIASGMQRIGRASHHVGTVSSGVIFPKYRGDLVACAAITEAMHEGAIEATRYPRNPLDVLAQQIVAMVSVDTWDADELFAAVRGAAPFAELGRGAFDGVLDMLSGLYPSDEFAELRPRITWNRVENSIEARAGSKQIAILNAGTIPDRGLYGVFLAGAETRGARVGELDEEMVFESRPGETFLLGASTWRIEEITHDRVLVSPAPGEPGKMPFWHGDAAGRSVEFGQRIGKLVREVASAKPEKAIDRLTKSNDLDALAGKNLVEYIEEQREATGAVPDDRTIVIERVRDELGEWRVCVLSPLGGRVLAPWSMAVVANARNELALDVEAMWSDDGFIIRFPETDEPPDLRLLLPPSDELEALVVRQLGSSSLFAARFREIASRALLLPRRRGMKRAPLWQRRKRAADLLQVAARYGSFPMLLETYRECLRDVFDMPALVELMRRVERREVRVVGADTEIPSPFAGSILFRYVANYIYDGDAPLAERRAQALSIDQEQLRDLLGEAELRDLLDPSIIADLEAELQHLAPSFRARTPDAIHDLLIRIGALDGAAIEARSAIDAVAAIDQLAAARRIVDVPIAGAKRWIAIEDVSRYRDALGVPLPPGIAERYLQPVVDPVGDLVLRYARTHGPFTSQELAQHLGIGRSVAEQQLHRLADRGRAVEGEFRPGGTQREWCESGVLRSIRQRSLARLRKEVEPVSSDAFGRLLLSWQGIGRARSGLNALLEVIENLQGYPIPASILESDVLPARIPSYRSSDLDTLTAAGEVVWAGIDPIGESDGRIALFLTDHLPLLWERDPLTTQLEDDELPVVEYLARAGASFFPQIHEGIGGGFPNETLRMLWNLVWKGVVVNDTFHPLRSVLRAKSAAATRRSNAFRSRRTSPQGSEGRWSLLHPLLAAAPSEAKRVMGLAQQLLERYGVVTREAAAAEALSGGFSRVYEILKRLEEAGRIRRGYFVSGVAAMQFALPAALDQLRGLRRREEGRGAGVVVLAAADPANPYGSLLKWPESRRSASRSAGARVVLVDGALAAWIGRGEKQIETFLPDDEPERSNVSTALAEGLAERVRSGARRAMLVAEIDGRPAAEHPLGEFLAGAGFVRTAMGWQMRSASLMPRRQAAEEETDDA